MSTKITDRLRDLYFSENKPDKLQPIDVALLSYLLLRESEDQFIRDSQETLAARLGCERGAIKRSIDRLEKMGWISVTKQFDWNGKTHRNTRGIFGSSGLSVNLEKLPKLADRATRGEPSEDAIKLAKGYTAWLMQHVPNKYKRFPKRWDAHQQYAAQQLIDRAGSVEMATALVNFALLNPKHKAAARTSLSGIRRKFGAIWSDYAEMVGQDSAQEEPAAV
jgi:DNA-binding transcriptional MocR family regulator